jgi:hypothetical protein
MPGKTSQLASRETRKQLLLLESDLNRAKLLEDLRDWQTEFHRAKDHITNVVSLASTAAKLAATFSTARRLFSGRHSTGGKRSWLSFLFDGITTGTSLWQLLRSHHKHEN